MNELTISGDLTEDLYKFIQTKVGADQTGENGYYLLGEAKALKIEPEQREDEETASVVVSLVIFKILKDVGIKVLTDLLVDFFKEHMKSKKETPEAFAKKISVTTKGDVKKIEFTNYSIEEITMLKSAFNIGK